MAIRPQADGKWLVEAANSGTAHVQVTGFEVSVDGWPQRVRVQQMKYVLPGSRTSWTVDAARPGHGAWPATAHVVGPAIRVISTRRRQSRRARSCPTPGPQHDPLEQDIWPQSAVADFAYCGSGIAGSGTGDRRPRGRIRVGGAGRAGASQRQHVRGNAHGAARRSRCLLDRGPGPRRASVLPRQPPHEQEGHRYYRLDAIAGAQVHSTLQVACCMLQLPARPSPGSGSRPPIPGQICPWPSATGLFANYDLYAQQTRSATSGSAYAELGLFSGYGVLTSTSVTRHTASATDHVRLDTTFTRDFPDHLQTLTLGDSFRIRDPGAVHCVSPACASRVTLASGPIS